MKNKLIEKFIQLTRYTYPHGSEEELVKFLPQNLEKDEAGNYFLKIGESETMFCCHLDTVGFQKEKVQHEFFKNEKGHLFVGTSGETVTRTYTNASGETFVRDIVDSTILGADDKSGVVLLMHLIENNIPGLYYFFLGEEVGAVGSKAIVRLNSEKFKDIKRCVAFDRRAYGSIISRQMGRTCCSDEFVKALSEEFSKNGMTYVDDKGGIFTDSATFMEIIPECTNLSVGYFNEHTDEECQNLTYLIKLSKSIMGIDWESLPTVREPNPYKTKKPIRGEKKPGDLDDDELKELFIDVDDAIESLSNSVCMNWGDFEPEREMIYANKRNQYNLSSVWIHEDGTITAGRQKFDNLDDFRDALKAYYAPQTHYYNRYGDDYNFDDDYDSTSATTPKGRAKQRDKNNNTNYMRTNHRDEEEEEDDDKDSFEEGLDLSEFLYDVFTFLYDENDPVEDPDPYISPKEMQGILDKYNKTVESLIYWIFKNRNDSKKTYGLTWNDNRNVFELEDK